MPVSCTAWLRSRVKMPSVVISPVVPLTATHHAWPPTRTGTPLLAWESPQGFPLKKQVFPISPQIGNGRARHDCTLSRSSMPRMAGDSFTRFPCGRIVLSRFVLHAALSFIRGFGNLSERLRDGCGPCPCVWAWTYVLFRCRYLNLAYMLHQIK